MTKRAALHGLMAEFSTPAQILRAAAATRAAGYRRFDAYTPYPVEGLSEALGLAKSRIPLLVLVGGLVGAGVGFWMQYWSMAVDYPFNSGGRPHNSWPVFIPITFEVLVLIGAVAAMVGLLILSGLPCPYHPVFNVPEFARASQDRFFLCIEASDPQFDAAATARFLAGLEPLGPLHEVPEDDPAASAEPATVPPHQTERVGTGRGSVLGLLLAAILLSGCQQKMASQPSYRPLEPAPFFSDGRSSRPLVAGTVARGHLRTDGALYTGLKPRQPMGTAEQKDQAEPPAETSSTVSNPPLSAIEQFERRQFVESFPFSITAQVLRHGRERYTIFCAVCHDPLGMGRGKIVERGYTQPKTYHSDRLRQAPPGYFFAVITEGYGAMPSYAAQIPPRDRWAIVAYVRALQLSQHFPAGELTQEMRAQLDAAEGKVPP